MTPNVPKLVGLDYGKARIGVAISDDLGMMAHPRQTVPAHPPEEALRLLAEFARKEKAEAFVLGLPLNMDGTEGPAAEGVRAFGKKLETVAELPVRFWDERLTTVTAQEMLHSAGRNAKKGRAVIDQVAAQVILQSYMDAQALGLQG